MKIRALLQMHKFWTVSLVILLVSSMKYAVADTTIFRNIDVTNKIRQFPNLVAYVNTSLQKAPAPILGKVVKKEFGTPEITRCWLNLDELWDYKTKKFDHNYRIGVDKYKDVVKKHRETWDWAIETQVNYYDYLSAFSANSKEIMLTIRRYEKDILTGNLPISMQDWKYILKEGLKHYKIRYPNIRYVEVGNEFHLKGFMDATDDEYYEFYKLGYEAVNEINRELRLNEKTKILVGGPITTSSHFLKGIEIFIQNFKKDSSSAKKLDFISWHEYMKPIVNTAHRESEIRSILKENELSEYIPMFISEHDPYHYDKDSDEIHFSNAATLIKSLYFTNLYSPNIKVFPWVLYHDENLQKRFMWFSGPNATLTAENELRMLPIGVAMKLLSKHKGQEIKVDNDIAQDHIVIASKGNKCIRVQAVNLAGDRPVRILLNNIAEKPNSTITIKKYILDRTHNNLLVNPDYSGRIIEVSSKEQPNINNESILLQHNNICKWGIVFWEIEWH